MYTLSTFMEGFSMYETATSEKRLCDRDRERERGEDSNQVVLPTHGVEDRSAMVGRPAFIPLALSRESNTGRTACENTSIKIDCVTKYRPCVIREGRRCTVRPLEQR